MKELKSLYRLAEKRNIEIINLPLPETASMSIELQDVCYIGIDNAVLDTNAEERTHLAHELGHCITGSFYNRHTQFDIRQRHENRADKWAVRRLIPPESLDDAVAEGHTELWDLAEFFGVTEEFMKKAVCLYTHGNLTAELYF